MKVSIELTPEQLKVVQEASKGITRNTPAPKEDKEGDKEAEAAMEDEDEDEEDMEEPAKEAEDDSAEIELRLPKAVAQKLIASLNKIVG